MYTVSKDNGRVVVTDTTTEKIIYSSPADAYIVWTKGGSAPGIVVDKVGNLEDMQLLTALANTKRLLQ